MTGVVKRPMTLADVAGFLSQAIGQEKALAAVQQAAAQLRLTGDVVSREEALQVLDHVALSPGIVGITARFAKSRLHLKWASGE